MERFDLLLNNYEALGKELQIVSNQLRQENNDFFNAIVENSTNFVAIIQDGKYVFVNTKGLRLMHCKSSSDIIDKSFMTSIHPDYQNFVSECILQSTNFPDSPLNIKMIRPDGTVFDSEINFAPFNYNKRPAVLTISRDITNELKYKNSLQREEKLRTDILNSFTEIIAFYSPGHTILWLNKAGKEQLNIHDESYFGKLCYKLWFNANKPCADCPVVTKKFETSERLVKMKDKRIWLVRHTPLFDQEGNLTGFIEFREDITEKENTKNELEKSHARQISAEIANSFGHFENNLTTGNVIWSQGVYNILSVPDMSSQEASEREFLKFIHPEDREELAKHLSLAYTGIKKFDRIFRIIDYDRKEKTIRGIGETKTESVSGNRTFLGVIQDITHISILEKQIFNEREKYKLLAENAPFGLILTLNNKPVYMNRTFIKWLKLESISDFEKINPICLFHPGDRKIAEVLLQKLKENKIVSPIIEKLRILNKNGNVRYIKLNIQNNTINNQVYVQTVVSDITADVLKERKQKQVAADALYLNQKNAILNEIESVLTKILSGKKYVKSKKDFHRIFEIVGSYKQLDKDWKMLIANFEEVHPGFFKRLAKTHPSLSPSDIKHCACIKMNFDTKEIARFFNIKAASVQIGRVRLKKKMNLSDSVDLRNYILNF
jgi:PAS domain S-box-containing protein